MPLEQNSSMANNSMAKQLTFFTALVHIHSSRSQLSFEDMSRGTSHVAPLAWCIAFHRAVVKLQPASSLASLAAPLARVAG